jgi:hypothetical protein
MACGTHDEQAHNHARPPLNTLTCVQPMPNSPASWSRTCSLNCTEVRQRIRPTLRSRLGIGLAVVKRLATLSWRWYRRSPGKGKRLDSHFALARVPTLTGRQELQIMPTCLRVARTGSGCLYFDPPRLRMRSLWYAQTQHTVLQTGFDAAGVQLPAQCECAAESRNIDLRPEGTHFG